MLHLREVLNRYRRNRDVEADTVAWISVILGKFEFFLGRAATVDDLTDDRVSDWVTHLLETGAFARQTVYSYRRGLLILWRFSFEAGLCERWPTRVKRVRAPVPIPEAISADDALRVLLACQRITGRHRSGLPRAKTAMAIVACTWDSGLRLGDLLRLAFVDFDQTGRGMLMQHKTGFAVAFQLSSVAIAAVDDIADPARKLVFGGVVPESQVYELMREASALAGVAVGTRKLRKSGATAVEIERPGAAMAYLGHRTPGLAARHYIDPRFIQRQKTNPPALKLPD